MGGDFTRLYYLNQSIGAARPSFTFRNLWDFANDAPYGEGGQFNSATGVPFSNRQDDREDLWGVFVQDDFKIRPEPDDQRRPALVVFRRALFQAEQP